MKRLPAGLTGEEEAARVAETSADLAYQLHFDVLKETATLATAAVAATLALAGSVLKSPHPVIWVSVACFGLASMTCMSGQVTLATRVAERRPVLKQIRLTASIAVMLMGVGAGVLTMSVWDAMRSGAAPGAARGR